MHCFSPLHDFFKSLLIYNFHTMRVLWLQLFIDAIIWSFNFITFWIMGSTRDYSSAQHMLWNWIMCSGKLNITMKNWWCHSKFYKKKRLICDWPLLECMHLRLSWICCMPAWLASLASPFWTASVWVHTDTCRDKHIHTVQLYAHHPGGRNPYSVHLNQTID